MQNAALFQTSHVYTLLICFAYYVFEATCNFDLAMCTSVGAATFISVTYREAVRMDGGERSSRGRVEFVDFQYSTMLFHLAKLCQSLHKGLQENLYQHILFAVVIYLLVVV